MRYLLVCREGEEMNLAPALRIIDYDFDNTNEYDIHTSDWLFGDSVTMSQIWHLFETAKLTIHTK